MPTYAYACTECDHTFEAVQSFSDDSLTVCPDCGGRLRKLYNAVGVVFKGSGFYRTDSRSGSKTSGSSSTGGSSEGAKDSGSSGSSSAGSSTSSSDSSSSSPSSSTASKAPAASSTSST